MFVLTHLRGKLKERKEKLKRTRKAGNNHEIGTACSEDDEGIGSNLFV